MTDVPTPKEMLEELQKYGYTQMDISEETGVTQATISRILKSVHGDTTYTTGCKIRMLRDKAAKRHAIAIAS